MSNRADLLLKIKALAERGIGGEQENAQALLDEMMKKYGVTEADLEAEKIKTEWFRFKDEMECRILRQIIYMVTGKPYFGCRGTYTNRPRKERGADCTAAERLEIEANYEFFKAAIAEEFEVFFTAFCYKNNLYPRGDKAQPRDMDDLTPEEKARAMKAGLMAEGMDRHTLRKALTAGNEGE